jgi:hypothetical protein
MPDPQLVHIVCTTYFGYQFHVTLRIFSSFESKFTTALNIYSIVYTVVRKKSRLCIRCIIRDFEVNAKKLFGALIAWLVTTR